MGVSLPFVLLIDDDSEIINLVGEKLKRVGFKFTSAQNGKEGIEIARKEKPDIVLLDLRMPEMDGSEVLAVLRDQDKEKNLKIVIYTSHNEYGSMRIDSVFAKKIGADLFLEKFTDLEELIKNLKELAKK